MVRFVRGVLGRCRHSCAIVGVLAGSSAVFAQGLPVPEIPVHPSAEAPVQPPSVFPVAPPPQMPVQPPSVFPVIPAGAVDVSPAPAGTPMVLPPVPGVSGDGGGAAASPQASFVPFPSTPAPSGSFVPFPSPAQSSGSPAFQFPPATAPAQAPIAFEAVWNNGLFFQTKDKKFVAHVGGVVQYDGAWYSASPGLETFPGGVGKFDDGVQLRRARMYMEGSVWANVDYKFEMEFMNGFSPAGLSGPVATNTISNSPGPTDAWVTVKQVPFLGNVRVGSQKEWISLEHLNSFRNLEFLERSYLQDFDQATRYNNGFSPGISAYRTWADDRVFSAIGAYKNDSSLIGYNAGDGQYAVTGRLTGLPVWMPDQPTYWHVGGSMSHRDPVNGNVLINVRSAVRNAPLPQLNLIGNTGTINASSQDIFNLETAAVYGRWTLQSEYMVNLVHGASVGTGPNRGTVRYQGFYTEVMCFLTGESREWDNKVMFFKKVIPKRNFLADDGCNGGGIGAWELAARYTYLDLDDKAILGGRLNNMTLGLNWYLNPNVKFQFNYDYLYRDGGPNALAKGQVHSFGTRMSLDF